MNFEVSYWLLRTSTIAGSVWVLGTAPSHPLGWFLLWPEVVSSHVWSNQYSTEYGKRKGEETVFLQADSSHFDLPELSVRLLNLGSTLALCGLLFPVPQLWKFLRVLTWFSAHHICFLLLRNHSPGLSDVQCFENYFFNVFFSEFLVVSDRR